MGGGNGVACPCQCTVLTHNPWARVLQGAKSAHKRERNGAKQGTSAKSTLKSNEAAKNIICNTCRQSFFITTRAPALEEHAANRHSKTMAECFPDFKP